MDFAIPPLTTPYYRHELSIIEAEYVMRENLNLKMDMTGPLREAVPTLRDKGYIEQGGLSDKSADFYMAYKCLDLQTQIKIWSIITFGSADIMNKQERAYRFCEEALELVQSSGVSREDLHTLVDYVFNRPVGEMAQEVGGVFTTLAVLCSVNDLDVFQCATTETNRIWSRIDEIREKQKNKPKASPLQGQSTTVIDLTEGVVRDRAEQQTLTYRMAYGGNDVVKATATIPENQQIDNFKIKVLELVEKRIFITMADLIGELAKEWVYIGKFDAVTFVQHMIDNGELSSFDYYVDHNPTQSYVLVCRKDVMIEFDDIYDRGIV